MPDATTQPIARQLGGSFAPPLDDAKFESYRKLAKDADPQVADHMATLIKMVETYRGRPKAVAKAVAKAQSDPASGTPHPSGLGTMFHLPETEVKRLWDVVPWQEEIAAYSTVFDKISPEAQKELRDAAFHLLWFAQELTLDREPITNDRL